jgi:hypothetical protein
MPHRIFIEDLIAVAQSLCPNDRVELVVEFSNEGIPLRADDSTIGRTWGGGRCDEVGTGGRDRVGKCLVGTKMYVSNGVRVGRNMSMVVSDGDGERFT